MNGTPQHQLHQSTLNMELNVQPQHQLHQPVLKMGFIPGRRQANLNMELNVQPQHQLHQNVFNIQHQQNLQVNDNTFKVISNTLQKTLDLYQQGKTIEEISIERNLLKGIINDHIVALISLKEITNFKIDITIYNSVIDFYENSSENVELKDIKIYFDEIDEPLSYFNIKLALAIYHSR
jgi:uncharacterized protein YpbB